MKLFALQELCINLKSKRSQQIDFRTKNIGQNTFGHSLGSSRTYTIEGMLTNLSYDEANIMTGC